MAKNDGGGAFSWFLAGLGLGSLLGVLYAPRAGQETRDDLVATALGSGEYVRQRGRDVQGQAGEYVNRGRGQVSEYVVRGKERLNQYTDAGKSQVGGYVSRGRGAVEAGRQKINDLYSQGANALQEQKEKLAASYEAGRQAYIDTTVPKTNEELISTSPSENS